MSARRSNAHKLGVYFSVAISVAVLMLPAAAHVSADESYLLPGSPTTSFVLGATLGEETVPVKVSWSAVSDTEGLDRYELEHSADGGSWLLVGLPSPLATKVTLTLSPSSTNAFRVRAVAESGQPGGWSTGAEMWLAATQESSPDILMSASWELRDAVTAYGGGLVLARDSGATATFTSTGTRMAWISQRGPKRGRATIFVDGVLQRVVDLGRPTNEPRRVVYQAKWKTAQSRTIQIRVEATAGRPRVDLDAILVQQPPPSTVLVGAGDIADCTSDADAATADLVESIEGTVFTTGDNVYTSGTEEEFAQCYEPTWGRFKSRTRPTPGNHDFRADPAAGPYFRYFGRSAGTAGQGWYSYDAGTWRVYALNSECARVGGCEPGSPQYEWLRQELASDPRRCMLAYWHAPRLSSGSHGDSTTMVAILELLHEAGTELIVNGHEHSYERFAPADPDGMADAEGGMRQFVIGTGGTQLRPFTGPPAPLTDTRDDTSHGVLKLRLDPGSYSWDFLPVSATGFTDSGSATCH